MSCLFNRSPVALYLEVYIDIHFRTLYLLHIADALEGSIAGFGENTVIVTPSFAKIHKHVTPKKDEPRGRFD